MKCITTVKHTCVIFFYRTLLPVAESGSSAQPVSWRRGQWFPSSTFMVVLLYIFNAVVIC